MPTYPCKLLYQDGKPLSQRGSVLATKVLAEVPPSPPPPRKPLLIHLLKSNNTSFCGLAGEVMETLKFVNCRGCLRAALLRAYVTKHNHPTIGKGYTLDASNPK